MLDESRSIDTAGGPHPCDYTGAGTLHPPLAAPSAARAENDSTHSETPAEDSGADTLPTWSDRTIFAIMIGGSVVATVLWLTIGLAAWRILA